MSLSIREKRLKVTQKPKVSTGEHKLLLVTIGYYEKPLQTLKVTTGEHNEVQLIIETSSGN